MSFMNITIFYATLAAVGGLIGTLWTAKQLVGSIKERVKQDARDVISRDENTKAIKRLTTVMEDIKTRVDNHEWRLDNQGQRLVNLEAKGRRLCRILRGSKKTRKTGK